MWTVLSRKEYDEIDTIYCNPEMMVYPSPDMWVSPSGAGFIDLNTIGEEEREILMKRGFQVEVFFYNPKL